MKVAIMTFHNALNYGAALQAYAFQQVLKSLGVECEFINYVNEHRKNAYRMSYYIKEELKKNNIKAALKYCVGSIFMMKRKYNFYNFYKENLQCTNRCYASSCEVEELNEKYDKFIIGSDQVWNHENNGNDFAYFLDFVKDNSKKISYSSSFGLAEISESLKEKYIKNLESIKYLSTRESYGVKLIKELTGRNAELVLDPVFLLDKNYWSSLFKMKRLKHRYIFFYTNRKSQYNDFISQTAYPLDGLKIYKLTRFLTPIDFLNPNIKVAYSISPEEFVETIAHAELVVTASFHCVALSIILNVPFVALLTEDRGKNERIINILKIAGLENRIFSNDLTLAAIDKPIDFKKVEARISKYIYNSLEFLKKAIYN